MEPDTDSPNKASSLPPLEISYEDDPRVLEEAAVDDYSLHVVPRSWRIGRFQLTMAWWGLVTAFFYIYVAAFVAMAFGTVNALIAIVLTIISYTAINAVITRLGSDSGLSVALFSRSMFGFVGAAIASLVFAATAIYYVIFEGSIIAVAAQAYFGGPINMWYAITVALTIPLVWRGVRAWLDKINGFLLPFFAVLMVAVIVWTLASNGYHGFLADAKAAPGTKLPWLQAFSVYMAVWVLIMYTMDFSRLSKPEDHKFNVNVSFGWVFFTLVFLVNGLIGLLLVSSFDIGFEDLAGQESALPVQIVGLTGLLGLILIVITQMRINTVNLYLASTNLQSFVSRAFRVNLSRTIWVLVACVIAYLVMLTNVFSYVFDALNYQAIAIVAWVGVALTHAVYLKRNRIKVEDMEFRPGRIAPFNPGGIAAWVIAFGVGAILKASDSDTSQFWDVWGLLLTFAISVGVYALSWGAARAGWFSMSRPNDPLDEVDDPWSARIKCHVCERSYVAREMDRDPSADHLPICAACGTGARFHAAAHEEHKQLISSERR